MANTKKILKISAITLIALLTIIIILPFFFKGKITEAVKKEINSAVNAKIQLGGIGLSLISGFPDLRLKITDMSIIGKDNFEGDTLMFFKTMKFDIDLLSVFGDKIKINSILIDKPLINIKVLQDGSANYDIVPSDSTATDSVSTEETDTSSSFTLALKSVKINNGKIIYDDKESDILTVIDGLNYTMTGDMTMEQTNLDMLAAIEEFTVAESGIKYLNKVKILFDSKMKADLVNWKYTFDENVLKINNLALKFDGFVAMPDTNIDMDLKFSAEKASFKDILSLVPAVYAEDFEGLTANGTFSFAGMAKGRYNYDEIPAFAIKLLVNNGKIQYPDLPGAIENINIDMKIENPGDYDINIVDINKFHLEMGQNPVDATLHLKTSANDMTLAGKVMMKIILDKLKDYVPMEDTDLSGTVFSDISFAGNMSDLENEQYDKFKLSGNLKLDNIVTQTTGMPKVTIKSSDLAFNPKYVNLSKFDMTIGKSDFHLNGTIDNIIQYVFSDQTLKANFNFSSQLIDANELMASTETDEPENQAEAAGSEDTSTVTAFEIPSNIDFTLKSNINKLLFDDMDITNIKGLISLKNSKMALDNLSLNMLDGSIMLSGFYDASDYKNPATDFSASMKNIDLQTTAQTFNSIKQLAPIIEKSSGKVSAELAISTKLDYYLNPVYNTLNGQGRFKSEEIAITDSKLFNTLADKTKIEKYRNPSVKNVDISFKIENGNIIIEPTQMNIAGSEFTAEGIANLDKTIKFNLGLTVPKDKAASLLNKVPGSQENLQIYAIVGGTADNPKIEKFSSNATDAISEKVEEKIEEKKEELKDEANKLISEADAKAQKLIADAKKKRAQLISEAEKKAEQIKKEYRQAADKILKEADKQANTLVSQAKNPIAKAAAQKTAEELKKKAKQKADKKIAEGDKKVEQIVDEARKKGDKLVEEAEKQAEKIREDARKKVNNA